VGIPDDLEVSRPGGYEKSSPMAVRSVDSLEAFLHTQDESYFGTHLVRSLNGERTYVTLDFWRSQQAYDKFRKRHFAKYTALDQQCEDLTESEREIGKFVRVRSE
jgi:quinol monooxygenase YgiN